MSPLSVGPLSAYDTLEIIICASEVFAAPKITWVELVTVISANILSRRAQILVVQDVWSRRRHLLTDEARSPGSTPWESMFLRGCSLMQGCLEWLRKSEQLLDHPSIRCDILRAEVRSE